MAKRFIVNETFTDEDTGIEYGQGAIYDIDSEIEDKARQWFVDGKARDADEDLTPEQAADAAKQASAEDDLDEDADADEDADEDDKDTAA